MKKLLTLLLLGVTLTSIAQNHYVDDTGSDSSGDGSLGAPWQTIRYAANQVSPGDTVFIRAGLYRNADFGDGDIWEGDNLANISQIHGAPGAYITFKNYPGETPVLEFDAAYALLIINSSYLHFDGLEIKGIADQITYQEAVDVWGLYKDEQGVIHDLAQQMSIVPDDPAIYEQTINKPDTPNATKPTYYNGRAIVANKSHHIVFTNLRIYDVPSAAIRSQRSDYVTIANNKVYDNTFYTTLGVVAITVSEAEVRPTGDSFMGEKIIIEKNEVWDNENKLIS